MSTADPSSPTPQHVRLLVLELGMARPQDYALSQGVHELKECGVRVSLQGNAVSVGWLGQGPRAFLLPGARALSTEQWHAAEDRARVSWAGREWLFLAHDLGGDAVPPPRGICLNGAGSGFPAAAVLLVQDGKHRGNFYRFRTEPFELGRGVHFQALRHKDGSDQLAVQVARDARCNITLDGSLLEAGSQTLLGAEQVLCVVDPADSSSETVRVVLP